MTLGRQLILSAMLVLAGLFAGMILFTVQNTQQFLNNQLSSHSQDTATVLGLSLSHVMKDNDAIVASRMVDSIWDSGYYQDIEVETLDGNTIVDKSQKVKVEGVPDWFIDILSLKTQKKDAIIQSGWNQVGRVFVESNPGFAYKQIWETFTDSLVWFCVIAAVGLGLGMFLLHIILKPLRLITKQANAICHQDFMVQEKLPWTIDLRQVVKAMNKMSARLKIIFEEQSKATESLREQAFQSPVTGLGNRRYFNMQFEHLTHDATRGMSGVLLMIELHDFKEFNDKFGYEKGDELLKSTAQMIKEVVGSYDSQILAHLGGAGFAILIPRREIEVGKVIGQHIVEKFFEFQAQGIADIKDVGHVGVCEFTPEDSVKDIMIKADSALRKAQSLGPNHLCVHEEQSKAEVQGAREWAKFFDEIIARQSIMLHYQPFKIFHTLKDEVYYEALLRLADESGELIPAGQFMPMAERLSKILELDKLVLKNLCEKIKQDKGEHTFSLNVSASSIDDEKFRQLLLQQLKSLGKLAKHLVVELPEYGVINRLEIVRDLFKRVRSLGAKTGIDHYGQNFASFGYLHSLSLNILKIDGSFIRNISENEDNQFFIRSLINIAHSLDIQVIAEAVETEEEKQILKKLKVDGIQGYLLGKPKETIES